MSDTATAPFWLQGNYAPVDTETEVTDLPVTGAIPPQLRGRYIRNGPNPRQPTSHWFLGDGMLHGVELGNGRATVYRRRWVRTRQFVEGRQFVQPDGSVDRTVGVSNTNIVRHGGKYLALVESSFPCEVSADLETIGVYDYGGQLGSAFTAHPKLCPTTAEMHFFGYGFVPPFLVYNVADESGALVHSVEIPVPGPTMIHDFNLTSSHVVFMDLPVVFDLELAITGQFPYRWDPDYGARLGVLPRRGTAAQVRWFDIEPCYVFHPLNSFDDGDRIVIDVARYPELWADSPTGGGSAFLHRFELDLGGDKVTETPLDDRPIEFPRVDDRRTGLPHGHGYAVTMSVFAKEPGLGNSTLKVDAGGSVVGELRHGAGRVSDEAVFAPAAPHASDDEGWLLAYVYDAGTDRTDLVIADARNMTETARVHLPVRVPHGFHGNWFSDR